MPERAASKLNPKGKQSGFVISIRSSKIATWIEAPLIFEEIEQAARKKIQKSCPHKENNFSSKGILLIGIVDPVFGGFGADLEVTEYRLSKVAQPEAFDRPKLFRKDCNR